MNILNETLSFNSLQTHNFLIYYTFPFQAGLYYVAPFVYITFANIPSIHLRIVHDNSSHWTLPFGAFPLFDTTNSPNYEIALFYQNACNFITFMCYMTISAAICSTMATLVLCCKILQHRIKTCIHRSTSMKIQEFNFKCVQMLTIVLAAVVSEFMTSYWGSELIKEYQAIGDTCYEIEFVGQDLRFQKMLRFVIQRTRTPLEFTVGGFSPLTMRTFLLVMKGAYSFFMFLRRE
ncbi:hypothetical protein RI129_007996 [Pyrocoelia pectoralis]|uniref:Uncharacterized protein n=1 Tax=Pyrocoelia pectoralis TaxID=417401 RepID=A0AAN7ZND7_9COLE